MHFHLPKPIHGWREFLGEVGIIVLGVMIALALDSIAEDLSWHRKVSEARQVIRYEVGHNLQLYKWRAETQGCVDRRLDELAGIVQSAGKTGRLPPLGAIYPPPTGTWPEGVWESQVSAETATHFPEIELASLARVYRFIEMTRQTGDRDMAAWRVLQTMVGPGRAIDAGEHGRLLQALVDARSANGSYAVAQSSIQRILQQSRLGADFPEIDPRNPPVRGRSVNAICNPIGTKIPAAYGLRTSS